MNKKPTKPTENRPVLIEVPKPVNQMTKEESDQFINEILESIDGKDKWNPVRSAPLNQGYARSSMGFQMGL